MLLREGEGIECAGVESVSVECGGVESVSVECGGVESESPPLGVESVSTPLPPTADTLHATAYTLGGTGL